MMLAPPETLLVMMSTSVIEEIGTLAGTLGYEASNHYFYTVNDLIEKCLQLDWLEGKMEEQTHGE